MNGFTKQCVKCCKVLHVDNFAYDGRTLGRRKLRCQSCTNEETLKLAQGVTE